MSVVGWIRDMLWHREQPSEAVEAKVIAKRITEKADDLRDHLSRYHRARDPFAALLADFYNRDQVEKIWHGPPS